jgi:hypothetical protein
MLLLNHGILAQDEAAHRESSRTLASKNFNISKHNETSNILKSPSQNSDLAIIDAIYQLSTLTRRAILENELQYDRRRRDKDQRRS